MAKKDYTVDIQKISISNTDLFVKLSGLTPRVYSPGFAFVSGSQEARKAITADFKKIQDSSKLIRHRVTSFHFDAKNKQYEVECILSGRSRVVYTITTGYIWKGKD